LHKHVTGQNPEVSQTASVSDHRTRYTRAMEGLSSAQGEQNES
jgi:hypothetical protein